MSFALNRLIREMRGLIWSFAVTGCIEDWAGRKPDTDQTRPRTTQYRICQMQSFIKISHVCSEARQQYMRMSQDVTMVLRNLSLVTLKLPINARIDHMRVHKGIINAHEGIINEGYVVITCINNSMNPEAKENNLIYGSVECEVQLYGDWPHTFSKRVLSSIAKALPSIRYLELPGFDEQRVDPEWGGAYSSSDVFTEPVNVKPWPMWEAEVGLRPPGTPDEFDKWSSTCQQVIFQMRTEEGNAAQLGESNTIYLLNGEGMHTDYTAAVRLMGLGRVEVEDRFLIGFYRSVFVHGVEVYRPNLSYGIEVA